jgi:hypothetical protein
MLVDFAILAALLLVWVFGRSQNVAHP